MWELEYRLWNATDPHAKRASGTINMGGLQPTLMRLASRVREHLGDRNELMGLTMAEGWQLSAYLYWNPSRIHYSNEEQPKAQPPQTTPMSNGDNLSSGDSSPKTPTGTEQ